MQKHAGIVMRKVENEDGPFRGHLLVFHLNMLHKRAVPA
jgi:hypothetical protein